MDFILFFGRYEIYYAYMLIAQPTYIRKEAISRTTCILYIDSENQIRDLLLKKDIWMSPPLLGKEIIFMQNYIILFSLRLQSKQRIEPINSCFKLKPPPLSFFSHLSFDYTTSNLLPFLSKHEHSNIDQINLLSVNDFFSRSFKLHVDYS